MEWVEGSHRKIFGGGGNRGKGEEGGQFFDFKNLNPFEREVRTTGANKGCYAQGKRVPKVKKKLRVPWKDGLRGITINRGISLFGVENHPKWGPEGECS